MSDIRIAIRCGWTVDEVQALDPDVHDVLVEELNREQAPSEEEEIEA